jgi:hypothetical protein
MMGVEQDQKAAAPRTRRAVASCRGVAVQSYRVRSVVIHGHKSRIEVLHAAFARE